MSNHVYRFLNSKQEIIYVGKTKKSVTTRLNAHFTNGHLKEKLGEVEKVEYLTFKSRLEMDLAEIYLINLWEPKLNTTHKHSEHVVFHPFDVNELEWESFDDYELARIRGKERVEESEMQNHSIVNVIEENALFVEMLNGCYDGNMFSYREFYSEYDYAESVLREGFFFKSNELNADHVNWLFGLLERHQQGKTSKSHTVDGEEISYES